MQRKQLICFAAVAVILVATFAGLSWYRDDIRSQLVPENGVLEGSLYGSVGFTVNGESFVGHTLRSEVTPICSTDDGTYCELSMRVSSNTADLPYFTLMYSYIADGSDMVPEDARRGSGGGSQWEYLYTDPMTGHELTFYVDDGSLESVRAEGRTVVEYGGSLEYADFDMTVDYRERLSYVNSVMSADPTPTAVYSVSGNENGVAREGTVTVTSVSSIMSGSSIREYVEVEVDVPGTKLPGFLTTFYSILGEGGSFYNQYGDFSVLLADGTFVESDSTIIVSTLDGWELTMEGIVTFSTLDESCNVVSQETVEFSYGVI